MANLPISGEWTQGFEIPAQTVTVSPLALTKLNVVLPFIESDVPQVIRLLKWCAELSGRVNYTLFLLPFKGLNFTEVKMYAERAFTDVQIISDAEGVSSDWKTDSKIRDAAGPNSMFRQTAWYFYFHKGLGPWLYLEPDCIPLKKDWLAQLEADYREGDKPISGVAMDTGDRAHLNGVAIYPANLIQVAPEVVTRIMWEQHQEMEVAFDVAGGKSVLDKAHLTDKIQLCYRAAIDGQVHVGAVLFHGDRSGNFIKALELDKNLSGGVESRHPVGPGNSTLPSTARHEVQDGETFPESGSSAPPAQNLSIGDQIRFHCDALLNLVSDTPSRKIRMVEELRKRKLIPRAAKIWSRAHR